MVQSCRTEHAGKGVTRSTRYGQESPAPPCCRNACIMTSLNCTACRRASRGSRSCQDPLLAAEHAQTPPLASKAASLGSLAYHRSNDIQPHTAR